MENSLQDTAICKRETELSTVLAVLDNSISRVASNLNELNVRLSIVSRVDPPSDLSNKEEERDFSSSLAIDLAAQAHRINSLAGEIELITSKLEI